MTELELHIPGKFSVSIEMPTKWDELSDKDMQYIATAINHNHSPAEVLCNLIALRAAAQKKRLPENWTQRLNAEGAAIEALPLIELLLEDNNRTINPCKRVGAYHGPDDNFKDLTCGEFEMAEPYYLLYNKTKDSAHLVSLAMMLWRKLDENYARRPCTGEDRHVRSFSQQFKPDTLQLVYLWYTGCRGMLPKRFPMVFSGGKDESGQPDLMGASKLIHSGAGNRNGTRDEIRRTPLNEYLFDCQLLCEQNEETENELKKMRR